MEPFEHHLKDSEDFSLKGLSKRREEKIHRMVANRQLDIVVLLENVTDPHNLGAVLRTCDSVGVTDVFILYNKITIPREDIVIGNKSASGAKRWIRIHYYDDTSTCVVAIRKKVGLILGTHLGASSKSIYDTSFLSSICIVMGNEKSGITDELLKELDGNISIPQMGMVKSLNISVAAAVILYEMFRQRRADGRYTDDDYRIESKDSNDLLDHYTEICHKNEKEFVTINYIHPE